MDTEHTPDQIDSVPRTSGQRAADSRARQRALAARVPALEQQLAAAIDAGQRAATAWQAALDDMRSQRDAARLALGQIDALAATVRQAVADGIRDALAAQ